MSKDKAEKAEKKNTQLTVAEQKRIELFETMNGPTQEIAKEFETKLGKAAEGLVMIRYDIGARLIKVVGEESLFGTNAVQQIADYLNIPGGKTALYALKDFAKTFDREFVKAQIALPMSNGRPLDTGHFIVIARLTSKKEQEKLFKRVRQECISVNALEEEVRAAHDTKNVRSGGRKPSVSTNPLSNLQKLAGLGKTLSNFLVPFGDATLSNLEEAAPDQINPRLLQKFEEAREQLETTVQEIGSTLELMKPVEERLHTVLDNNAAASKEEDAEAEDDEDDETAAPVAAAKPAGKKNSKKPEGSKGGKKPENAKKGGAVSKGGKASRRPAAV